MALYVEKSKIIGQGLYTDTSIKKGGRVGVIHGPVHVVHKFTGKLIEASLNWIGCGRYSWIDTKSSPFRYINHSCDPNTFICGKRIVRAIRNIAPGEELTMDYSLTEPDPLYKMPTQCRCGSSRCRKQIGGISTLTRDEFKAKERYATERFRLIYKKLKSGKTQV